MNTFRKLSATALIGITIVLGVSQLSSGGGSATASPSDRSPNLSAVVDPAQATRQGDGHLEAQTALDRNTETSTSRSMGLILGNEEVSAARAGSTRNAGIPTSVDLRQWAMPVGHQGTVNSCVAWSIDYAMLGWYANRDGIAGKPFAPMFTYSQINGGVDRGSQPTDALNLVQTTGSHPKAGYWQGDYDWQTQPTAAQKANASNYKISGYQTVFAGRSGQGSAGVNALANALAAGKPVTIAMAVRSGFQNLTAANPIDQDVTNPVLGYHAVLALGYDQNGLIIQNSWGTSWGAKGFGWVGWNVVGADVYSAYTISGLSAATTTTDTTNNTNNTNTDTTTTAVSIGAVNVGVAPGYHVASNVPVTAFWTATGNVKNYTIWTSTDGGAWVDSSVRLTSATTPSAAFGLNTGSSYRFAVAAFDAAGKRSAFSYSAPFTPSVIDDSQAQLSNGWNRYNWSSAYGNQAVTSSVAGSSATLSFTGRSVALVAPKFATAGQARIYLDGVYDSTVDLYKATLDPKSVSYSHYWTTSGTHTITIQVIGTNGRPRFDIDAFAILK